MVPLGTRGHVRRPRRDSPTRSPPSWSRATRDLATQEFSKADRGGRIFIDIGRNRAGATFAAAYTVRARPGAPVSAPCTWDEVASGAVAPQTFTLRTMPARLDAVGDLWAALARGRRRHASTLASGFLVFVVFVLVVFVVFVVLVVILVVVILVVVFFVLVAASSSGSSAAARG